MKNPNDCCFVALVSRLTGTVPIWGNQFNDVAYCDVTRGGQSSHSNRQSDCSATSAPVASLFVRRAA